MESGLPVRQELQDDKFSVLSGGSKVSKSSSVIHLSLCLKRLKKSIMAKLTDVYLKPKMRDQSRELINTFTCHNLIQI